MAGRARHALPRARHRAARRRRGPARLSRLGHHPRARAPPRARRRRRGHLGGVPAPLAGARPRGRALPRAPPGCACPTARRGARRYRRPPDLEDWLVLLSDYALRCLAGSEDPAAARRYEAIAAALRELGFQLDAERDPPRRVGGRPAADGLAGEDARTRRAARRRGRDARRRAARRRAVRRRARRRSRPTTRSPACSTPPPARPAPPSRRSPPTCARRRCARCWSPAAGCAARRPTPTSCSPRSPRRPRAASPFPSGIASSTACSSHCAHQAPNGCRARGSSSPTRLLVAGTTGVLVGTRGLLGEGWDCPPVNVLVDLGVAATSVSTQQARGRSLRLDPRDPEKLASNWDVVCVAPDLVRGTADYERFVRRHLHLFAPAEDGEIEAGPSHVHPGAQPVRTAGGPTASPPSIAAWSPACATATRRASAGGSGRLTAAQELRTIVARPHREPAEEPAAEGVRGAARVAPIAQRVPLGAGAAGAALALAATAATGVPALLAGLALAPAGAAVGRAAPAPRGGPPARRPAARRRRGRDRCRLRGARRALPRGRCLAGHRAAHQRLPALRADRGNARGERALRDRSGAARRRARPPPVPGLAPARRARPRRRRPARARAAPPPAVPRAPPPGPVATSPRHKLRAEAFARAFHRRLGPGRLVFTQRSQEGREARAEAAGADGGYETVVREVWV